MFAFQTLILILLSLLVISLPVKKRTKLIFSLFFSFFLTVQLSSVYFGGSFVDYKFYMHILATRQDILSEHFVVPAALFLILFLVFITVLYRTSFFVNKFLVNRPKVKLAMILVLLIVLCLPQGMLWKIAEVGKMLAAPNKEFLESLNDLGIDSTNYVFPDQIKAEKGYNLVILVLESMEKGWIEDPYTKLTPNLNRLAQDWSFIPMTQREGSNFTSAAIYTMMTGIPAFFRMPGNKLFVGSAGTKMTHLGHILDHTGYSKTYIVAQPDFSSMYHVLKTFGFDVHYEETFDTTYEYLAWGGTHDYDLFKEVKKVLLQKRKNDQPYAVFVSTLSTHFPDGIFDKRIEEIVGKKRSDLETMVAGTDYLVGDLVEFMDKNGILENTRVIILPDHLWMGYNPAITDAFNKDRSLYVITNGKTDHDTSRMLYQMELPGLILNVADIRHNAKFLSDYISDKDFDPFINNNKNKMLALNESSLLRLVGFEQKRIPRGLKRRFNTSSEIKNDTPTK